MSIYRLIEWDDKGWGYPQNFSSKREAMANRQCTLTRREAIKKYGENHFAHANVMSSEIQRFASMRALQEGRSTSEGRWY